LIDAGQARDLGHVNLGRWLAEAERLWTLHGRGRSSFLEQLDHLHKLSAQFPIASRRVLYSKSGTLPAACVLRDPEGVIDHKLYWAPAGDDEAHFLAAILNSETARGRVSHLQARGQWGARDFDKLMFGLPIPKFDQKDRLHGQLAAAGKRAEEVAYAVPLRERIHFTTARREIRKALAEDGVGAQIEKLVEQLLG